jgi:hypothetical protein
MRKVPTCFVRDPHDLSRVTDEWHPDCLWVRDGEGTPFRKYDGTCVMHDNGRWWARREVKPGRKAPGGFLEVQYDEANGKKVGWEPAAQSPFTKFLGEALEYTLRKHPDGWPYASGTYELCGPKINGNPEGLDRHVLIRHADAQALADMERTYEAIRRRCVMLREKYGMEGIVFHHPDGRMAKVKGRDFK